MGPMMKEEIIQEPIITLSIFLLSDVLLCETGISHRMSSLFGEVLKNFFELERLRGTSIAKSIAELFS